MVVTDGYHSFSEYWAENQAELEGEIISDIISTYIRHVEVAMYSITTNVSEILPSLYEALEIAKVLIKLPPQNNLRELSNE